MVVGMPLPVIAGAIIGSIRQFDIVRKTQKVLRKLTVLSKKEIAIRIKSNSNNQSKHSQRNDLITVGERTFLKLKTKSGKYSTARPFHSQVFHCLESKKVTGLTDEIERIFKSCNVRMNAIFATAIPFWKQKSARKIAEGSYGEIYCFRNIDGTCRIFKSIPVEGQHPKCEHPNIPLVMAVPDVVSTRCLSDLNEGTSYIAPNFPAIYSISLVRDKFPELLSKAWWDYKKSTERFRDPAEHPQPDEYPEAQAYLTMESSFCGMPLNMKILKNAWLGVSIMTQIVSALAVAEAAYNFEHRDLHLGNILMQNTHAVSLKYTLHNQHFCVNTVGYQVFIIDFTLSRIHYGNNVHYVGLDELAGKRGVSNESDESIWLNHNNMYRIMADYSKGEWKRYMPVTNIIWLKYLNENILAYLERNNPGFMKIAPDEEDHKQMRALRLLRKWNDLIIQRKSAADFLWNVALQDNPLIFVCKHDT